MQQNQKQQVFELLLEQGGSVLVSFHLNRAVVPPWFAGYSTLTLEYGLNTAVPIPDLRVDGTGISGTLSFGRTPHATHVPWEAVYLVFNLAGLGAVWPADAPAEAPAEFEEEHTAVRERGSLRVVGGAAQGTLRPSGRLRAV